MSASVKVAPSLILGHLAATNFPSYLFRFKSDAKLRKEQQVSFGNSTKYSDFINDKYFLRN